MPNMSVFSTYFAKKYYLGFLCFADILLYIYISRKLWMLSFSEQLKSIYKRHLSPNTKLFPTKYIK